MCAAALLAGCAPPPVATAPREAAQESWYAPAVEQLAGIDRQAGSLYEKGKVEQAAALIEQGQPLMNRLLAVPRPSLGAMEAASDLDDLYGRMMLSKGHIGWARLIFQKNVARWKNWTPQTPETARRLKQARSAIAECDRKID